MHIEKLIDELQDVDFCESNIFLLFAGILQSIWKILKEMVYLITIYIPSLEQIPSAGQIKKSNKGA